MRRAIREAGEWPYNVAWLLDAPWAHPIWSQYVVVLFDLSTRQDTDPVILMEGATHEVEVWALDPNHRLEEISLDPPTRLQVLQPMNHGYQFRALSDQAATERIDGIVAAIESRTLSPDTDFVSTWDRLFEDGVSLRRGRGHRAAAEDGQEAG